MIPAVLCVALLIGCKNAESPQEATITVEQRRASIDAAMEYLDAGRFTEALAIMNVLVTKDPRGAETQESFGLVLLACATDARQNGDNQEAKKYQTRALEAYKDACETATNPGLLQLSTAQLAHMQDDEQTALHFYKLAHNSNSQDARAAFFIAQIKMLNKNWKEAKTWIDESIQRDSMEPHALLSSALIEAELGNTDLAIPLAKKGCAIQPNDPNLRFIQARVLRISGQPTHAIDILSALPADLQASDIVRNEKKMCEEALQAKAP